MAKSQKELNELKKEYKTLTTKLKELTNEELKIVSGGASETGDGGSGEEHRFPGSDASSIAARASSTIGKPYENGAVGPDTFDASGLVSYCVTGTNVRVGTVFTFMGWPRVSNPEPGNICVNSYHCGIYVGNGQMIHAPGFGQTVCYGPVQAGMIYVRYQ